MAFVTRAAIALLAGVGAGLIGFWVTWESIRGIAGQNPGIGHDGWVLAGIFAPGVLVPLTVFRILSRAVRPDPT
jgi:hypothetical protein